MNGLGFNELNSLVLLADTRAIMSTSGTRQRIKSKNDTCLTKSRILKLNETRYEMVDFER